MAAQIEAKRRWPRIITWTLVMVAALVATGALGVWQYSVAHRDDVAKAVLAAEAVGMSDVHDLGSYVQEQTYGQLVALQGQLDCSRAMRVEFEGNIPAWIVCPLSLVDGSVVAVVLGKASLSTPLPTIKDMVAVVGRLQPAQDTSQLTPLYEPSANVDYLNTDELVLRWRSDVLDGYVVTTKLSESGRPLTFEGISLLPQSSLVLPPVGIELRNLLYAWQWWFFAAFAIFLWGRFIRDEFAPETSAPPQDL